MQSACLGEVSSGVLTGLVGMELFLLLQPCGRISKWSSCWLQSACCVLLLCIFHLDPTVQAFLGSQKKLQLVFVYCCHGGKEASQRLRKGLYVLKWAAWPSFICESEPNNLKRGYNGATFINRWNETMLVCLNAFTCVFKSAVWKAVCKRKSESINNKNVALRVNRQCRVVKVCLSMQWPTYAPQKVLIKSLIVLFPPPPSPHPSVLSVSLFLFASFAQSGSLGVSL